MSEQREWKKGEPFETLWKKIIPKQTQESKLEEKTRRLCKIAPIYK